MLGILSLVAFGTIGFWAFLIVVLFWTAVLIDTKHSAIATAVLVATVWAICVASKFSMFKFILIHPLAFSACLVGYLLLGATWSLAKWYLFLRKGLNEYDNKKASFLEKKGAYFLTTETAKEFLRTNSSPLTPSAADYKSILVGWIAYWPFSLASQLTRGIWESAYELLQSTYQKIANKAFSKVIADRVLAKKEPNNFSSSHESD